MDRSFVAKERSTKSHETTRTSPKAGVPGGFSRTSASGSLLATSVAAPLTNHANWKVFNSPQRHGEHGDSTERNERTTSFVGMSRYSRFKSVFSKSKQNSRTILQLKILVYIPFGNCNGPPRTRTLLKCGRPIPGGHIGPTLTRFRIDSFIDT